MIISFTIKNFKSYKDEAEFSFEAVDSNFKNENVTVNILFPALTVV